MDAVDSRQLNMQHHAVKEEQGTQRLRVGTAGDLALVDQVRHEGLDFGSSHFRGMAQAVEAYVPSCPIDVSPLGANAIMVATNTIP
jgi:hypothetical protein